jgi:hypothetical protein
MLGDTGIMNRDEFWGLQAELDRRQAELDRKADRWVWIFYAVVFIGLPILAASNIDLW